MDKFKVGDIVRLKSGGPAMTVQGEATNGDVSCVWFAHAEALRSNTFPPLTLERQERAESSNG
jgi:uncharacterized protein YodC (DUF2158 family)